MDPKLKRVKKEIQERESILKLNIRTPFSQRVHIQIGAKGRREILPFHSQNCPLADNCPLAELVPVHLRAGPLHSIVKGMVGRERGSGGGQLASEILLVMGIAAVVWAKPTTIKVMALQLAS